jgi:hypothetical protein
MFKVLSALLFLAALSMPAAAEVLLLDAIDQEPPNNAQGVLRPQRGEKMPTVESRFGKPEKISGPVGEPPITRWDYPGYSVFFEYDTVLDTVVHRKP